IRHPLGSAEPPAKARKGTRNMYQKGRWLPASLWEMEMLEPGNKLAGPAIVEHPATTLVVPDGRRVEVDEWGFLWLRCARWLPLPRPFDELRGTSPQGERHTLPLLSPLPLGRGRRQRRRVRGS